MIFPYLYTDMQAKHIVIIALLASNILSASAIMVQDTAPAIQDTIRFDDGSWYLGQIADSLFNGYGKMVYPDSTVYEGNWKDGLWNGKGELSYPDGDHYSGNFSNHRFSGYGTYLYANGDRYEGYWDNGMFNGPGTMDYADGSTYAGLWKDDMKEGLGVMYDARTQSLYKGYFVKDRFSHPVSDNSETPDNKPLLNPSPRPVVQDGRFHYKGLTNISLSYGLGQILSIHVHYHISDWFFAGGQLGLNMANYGIGEVSETTNDDTGEKVTLVEWDSYMDEVLTEHTYPFFKIAAECGVSWKRLSLGASVGLGLDNTVRNCRSKEGNDSYYEPGTLYFRSRTTGARFAYDIYTEFVPKMNLPLIDISIRAGYSNLDLFHLGLGVVF